jgi:hypothetical protein
MSINEENYKVENKIMENKKKYKRGRIKKRIR